MHYLGGVRTVSIFIFVRGVRSFITFPAFLYVLPADSLYKIFNKGKTNDLSAGLVPQIHDKSVTICHDADDTIIFSYADQQIYTELGGQYWPLNGYLGLLLTSIKLNYIQLI